MPQSLCLLAVSPRQAPVLRLQRALARPAARLLCAALVACAHAQVPAQHMGDASRREVLAPLPVPRGLPVEPIAPNMRMNGSPMQISKLQVSDTSLVEAFYKDYFAKRAEAGVMSDVEFQGRRLLSGLVDKRLITVELLPERSGYSVLVSSLVPERIQAPEKLAKGTPRMPGTDVLQVIESIEPVGGHTTTSMRNRFSVESNAYYLRAQMLLQGWHRVRDETMSAGSHRQMAFAKPGRQMRVDLQRSDDATLIVFNETL